MPEELPSNLSQPEQPGWQYSANDQSSASEALPAPSTSTSPVKWRSHEFIAHPKGMNWYLGLGVGTGLLAILVFLISGSDWVPVGVVIITAITFGIFASRQPRELDYTIDSDGVTIGDRTYPFGGFKSFSQVDEDGVPAIWLMPLKRFMPIISLYFDPANEPQIIDALSNNLPFEDLQPGLVDNLMHRLKF
jgi:hypothetical protein